MRVLAICFGRLKRYCYAKGSCKSRVVEGFWRRF